MINLIKKILLDKYLDWRLKRWPESNIPTHFQTLLQNLKHVLIIMPENLDLETIQPFLITPLYYLFGEELKISTFEKKNFRKEDSTWLGLPKKRYLDLFQSEKIDMIIDLSRPEDKFSTYVCALLEAPLKITLEDRPYEQVYNMRIRTLGTTATLEHKLDTALKYLEDLKNLKPSKVSEG